MDLNRNWQREKTLALRVVLGFAFFYGLSAHFVDKNVNAQQIYSFIHLIISTFLQMHWYLLDAQQHNFKIPKPLFITPVAVNGLGAPFYFYKTRPKKFLISILCAIMFLLAIGIAAGLGEGAGYLLNAIYQRITLDKFVDDATHVPKR